MREDPGNTIRVSAAIVRERDKILVCRRRGDQPHPRKWEFPGGKIEPGETPQACLQRELHEELGIDATIGELLTTSKHSYPAGPTVELWFFNVDHYKGRIQNLIFEEMRWLMPAEMADIDLLEADLPIVEMLATRGTE